MTKPIVFISGPMSGYPNLNREAFHEAARLAESLGYTALNPALLPGGLPEDSYMPICFSMLDAADCIYILPNSGDHLGAILEQQHAAALGLKRIETESELRRYIKNGKF